MWHFAQLAHRAVVREISFSSCPEFSLFPPAAVLEDPAQQLPPSPAASDFLIATQLKELVRWSLADVVQSCIRFNSRTNRAAASHRRAFHLALGASVSTGAGSSMPDGQQQCGETPVSCSSEAVADFPPCFQMPYMPVSVTFTSRAVSKLLWWGTGTAVMCNEDREVVVAGLADGRILASTVGAKATVLCALAVDTTALESSLARAGSGVMEDHACSSRVSEATWHDTKWPLVILTGNERGELVLYDVKRVIEGGSLGRLSFLSGLPITFFLSDTAILCTLVAHYAPVVLLSCSWDSLISVDATGVVACWGVSTTIVPPSLSTCTSSVLDATIASIGAATEGSRDLALPCTTLFVRWRSQLRIPRLFSMCTLKANLHFDALTLADLPRCRASLVRGPAAQQGSRAPLLFDVRLPSNMNVGLSTRLVALWQINSRGLFGGMGELSQKCIGVHHITVHDDNTQICTDDCPSPSYEKFLPTSVAFICREAVTSFRI